jgi:HEPN domain-containing protein
VRVRRALDDNDPEIAGFLLQQAAEKFLKAFLLAKGWKLVRTHNLGALLDEAVKHDPLLGRYRPACLNVSAYYLDSRYPAILTGDWSDEDVRGALQNVEGLFETVRAALQPPQA